MAVICGLMSAVNIFAQQNAPLSLQQAIDYAIANRREIKIQELNADHSDNETKKVVSRLLPQLSSDIDMRYNGRLPTSVIPGEAFGTAGSPSRRVQLGAAYNTVASLDLNIPIYSPTDYGDRKIARGQAEYDRMNVRKSEIDIKSEVTQSYFNVLISGEKLKLSKANLDKALSIYLVSKDQLVKGSITKYDMEKSRIDYENAKSDLSKNENNYRLSLADLSYRLGTDAMQPTVLSDSLVSLYAQYKSIVNESSAPDRIELKLQKLQENIFTENIRKQKNAYLPTLSFYGNYSAQNLNSDFSLFKRGYWDPYNYVGIKASIPVFDGLLKQRTKKGYQIQLQSAKLTYEKLERDFSFEVKTTKTAVANDQKDIENQTNNLKQAEDLYRIDADRYSKGAIKQTDLNNTYYTLQQAQSNYLNAMYSFLLDVVQYKKALGKL
ncbi:TolC family protein [Pedobacter sp. UBA5917]|uniref:TolC family protein n=1 Tax=Pedobacter sp. UBA5917 TaxID=1947061 RepID=UPI0025EAA68B|nr:TolC family protein [Pedobacter sp. UBA5917]